MDCSAPTAQVPLSPPGPVPALPDIYIYYLLPTYNKNLTTLPTPVLTGLRLFPRPPNPISYP